MDCNTSDEIVCSSNDEELPLFLALPVDLPKKIFVLVGATPRFTPADWTSYDTPLMDDPLKLSYVICTMLLDPQLTIKKNLVACSCSCKQLNALCTVVFADQLKYMRDNYHQESIAQALREALHEEKISLCDITGENGNTSLHQAANKGWTTVVQILLLAADDVQALLFEQNNYKNTALHMAVAVQGSGSCASAEIIKVLIKAADNKVKELLMLKNGKKRTAYMLAQKYGNEVATSFLKDMLNFHGMVIHELEEEEGDINYGGDERDNPCIIS
jgi:ankyrin repeat protein